jgi:hypothetical protein
VSQRKLGIQLVKLIGEGESLGEGGPKEKRKKKKKGHTALAGSDSVNVFTFICALVLFFFFFLSPKWGVSFFSAAWGHTLEFHKFQFSSSGCERGFSSCF